MVQIRAKPRHLFSWSFDLYLDGRLLAGFDMAWWREGGQFSWGDTEYQLSREGLWSGDFLLVADGEVHARATKESAFARSFVVRLDERELRLEAASAFARSFRLLEDGSTVGSITPDHLFTRACTLDVPGDVPVPAQVFIFWLVVLMWRRADSAAGAAGAS